MARRYFSHVKSLIQGRMNPYLHVSPIFYYLILVNFFGEFIFLSWEKQHQVWFSAVTVHLLYGPACRWYFNCLGCNKSPHMQNPSSSAVSEILTTREQIKVPWILFVLQFDDQFPVIFSIIRWHCCHVIGLVAICIKKQLNRCIK